MHAPKEASSQTEEGFVDDPRNVEKSSKILLRDVERRVEYLDTKKWNAVLRPS